MKRIAWVGMAAVFLTAGAAGAGGISAGDKVLAQEAALVDAYARLVDNVKGCNVEGFTVTSKAVVDFTATIKDSRAFVRGARVVAQGCDADGLGWAVVKITLKEVIENVDNLQRKVAQDGEMKFDFSKEKTMVSARPVTVTAVGFGTVRGVRLDPTLKPTEAEEKYPLVAEARKAASGIRADCTTQEFILAMRAAEAQALLSLLKEIDGLSLVRMMYVENGVTDEDLQTVEAGAFIKGAALSRIEAEDNGFVAVTVKMYYRSVVCNTSEVTRQIVSQMKHKEFVSRKIEEKTLAQTPERTGHASCKAAVSGGEDIDTMPLGEVRDLPCK